MTLPTTGMLAVDGDRRPTTSGIEGRSMLRMQASSMAGKVTLKPKPYRDGQVVPAGPAAPCPPGWPTVTARQTGYKDSVPLAGLKDDLRPAGAG